MLLHLLAAETPTATAIAGWSAAIIGPVVVWFVTTRPGQKDSAAQSAAQFVVDAAMKIAQERIDAEHDCQEQLAEVRATLVQHEGAIRECREDRALILEVAQQAGLDLSQFD